MSNKYNGILGNENNQDNDLCCQNNEDNTILNKFNHGQTTEEFIINALQFATEAVKAYSQSNKAVLNLQDKQVVVEYKEQNDKIEEANSVNNKSVDVWVYNNIVVDFSNFVATVDGEIVNLGVVPIRVLKILLEYKGKTLTRNQILNELWGTDKDLYDRTVDSHISILNKTLGLKRYIRSVRGIGYRID